MEGDLMQRTPVSSSALASVGYDTRKRQLEVEFTSGRVYVYFDFPVSEYENLLAAESLGRYFGDHVRNAGYRYAQIRGDSKGKAKRKDER
jgi:hypothetical protein